MTEVVVVERSFAAPASFDELTAREAAVAWCLEQHAVRAVCSYLACDGRNAVCVYRAPDADAVRATQRTARMPLDHAWTAHVVHPFDDARAARDAIIVQRELDPPVTASHVEHVFRRESPCLALHRAELLASYLSRDGQRMVCVFSAPDAESVRIANRQMKMPVTRAWPAIVRTS